MITKPLRKMYENEKGLPPFTNSFQVRQYVLWLEEKVDSLQKLMDDIQQWSDATFGDDERTIAILHHLKKEVQKTIDTIENRTVGVDEVKILLKLADCFYDLADAINHVGYSAMDILDATRKKLEINRKHIVVKQTECNHSLTGITPNVEGLHCLLCGKQMGVELKKP